MNYPEHKKKEYWNHFLTLKSYWGYCVTKKKLEKIKLTIWNDEEFWDDILGRHDGANQKPLDMNTATYEHCFGNFAGMIYQTLIERQLIKS